MCMVELCTLYMRHVFLGLESMNEEYKVFTLNIHAFKGI